MMAAPTKFMFDTDFAGGPRKPVEPMITVAEHEVKLAEAETAAHKRGYAQGQNDAQVEVNRRIAATLENVAQSLIAANRALQAIEARLECEAVEVAVAVARKLAPTLVAREPFAEISALASDCFRQLVAAPHIVVRVNDAVYATAKEKLDDIARAHTFEGRLVVLAEPDIAAGDCRIEWADGGINRDGAGTDAVIGEAVTGYISARRNLAGPDPRRPAAKQETPKPQTPPHVADAPDIEPAVPTGAPLDIQLDMQLDLQPEPQAGRASAHDLLENEF
jgi:flagellar assembly protein FliH